MDKTELMQIIGQNLKKYREANGLTQESLAEMADISTPFYANLERGKKGMTVLVLRNLADALGVNVYNLLYDDTKSESIHNIEVLLKNKPQSFIILVEKIIRLCAEGYSYK